MERNQACNHAQIEVLFSRLVWCWRGGGGSDEEREREKVEFKKGGVRRREAEEKGRMERECEG